MKKLLLVSLMAVASVASADYNQFINEGAAEAASSAGVVSGASTANFGNGFSSQASKSWADNKSGAGVRAANGEVATYAGSAGQSGASSAGLSFGAFGATGALAGQTGSAGAGGSSEIARPFSWPHR